MPFLQHVYSHPHPPHHRRERSVSIPAALFRLTRQPGKRHPPQQRYAALGRRGIDTPVAAARADNFAEAVPGGMLASAVPGDRLAAAAARDDTPVAAAPIGRLAQGVEAAALLPRVPARATMRKRSAWQAKRSKRRPAERKHISWCNSLICLLTVSCPAILHQVPLQ